LSTPKSEKLPDLNIELEALNRSNRNNPDFSRKSFFPINTFNTFNKKIGNIINFASTVDNNDLPENHKLKVEFRNNLPENLKRSTSLLYELKDLNILLYRNALEIIKVVQNSNKVEVSNEQINNIIQARLNRAKGDRLIADTNLGEFFETNKRISESEVLQKFLIPLGEIRVIMSKIIDIDNNEINHLVPEFDIILHNIEECGNDNQALSFINLKKSEYLSQLPSIRDNWVYFTNTEEQILQSDKMAEFKEKWKLFEEKNPGLISKAKEFENEETERSIRANIDSLFKKIENIGNILKNTNLIDKIKTLKESFEKYMNFFLSINIAPKIINGDNSWNKDIELMDDTMKDISDISISNFLEQEFLEYVNKFLLQVEEGKDSNKISQKIFEEAFGVLENFDLIPIEKKKEKIKLILDKILELNQFFNGETVTIIGGDKKEYKLGNIGFAGAFERIDKEMKKMPHKFYEEFFPKNLSSFAIELLILGGLNDKGKPLNKSYLTSFSKKETFIAFLNEVMNITEQSLSRNRFNEYVEKYRDIEKGKS